ncbi:hypothetical protein FBU59_004743, partial [Linderina macrospora]
MSVAAPNTQVLANKYSPSSDISLDSFKVVTAPAPTKESLNDNQVLIRNLYLSIDPYTCQRLIGDSEKYIPQFELNKPIRGYGSAVVEASTNPDFAVGEIVDVPDASWENLSVVDAAALRKAPSGANARDL